MVRRYFRLMAFQNFSFNFVCVCSYDGTFTPSQDGAHGSYYV
jgi:hypothetical protein